jgi:hypothetical protein
VDEPERPPPHAGERLGREDVERLIEEHGGPEGLDLQGADLHEADLSKLDLHGAWLGAANLEGAGLFSASLRTAFLACANLRGADLFRVDLCQADLSAANLEGADLRQADLRRARLADANVRDAKLDEADWGDYVLADEQPPYFGQAASVYRALKQRHTEAGLYDVAGEFHYREMEARRKAVFWPYERRAGLALTALGVLYGYGERPWRIVSWAAAVVLGLAVVCLLPGVLSGGFPEALYYSVVSFTALGYGAWAPEPQGWAGKFLGAGESFLGVFMMALFLVTFTRKMTR